jgi:hypothetical protein
MPGGRSIRAPLLLGDRLNTRPEIFAEARVYNCAVEADKRPTGTRMDDDESTLTFGPDDSRTGSSGFPQVPALTIIWHPDLDRVGQIAPLTSLLESGVVHLSRDEPIFLPPGADAGEPLAHRGISLQHSVLDIVYSRGTFELRRADPSGKIEIDREPLGERRRVSPEDLQRGLIIRASRHFVFASTQSTFRSRGRPPSALSEPVMESRMSGDPSSVSPARTRRFCVGCRRQRTRRGSSSRAGCGRSR